MLRPLSFVGLLLLSSSASASVLGPPSCTANAKVNERFKGILRVEIVEVTQSSGSCASPGDVFEIDPPTGGLAAGTKFTAGLAFGSSMGPQGAVRWVHWSPLKNADGGPMTATDGRPVAALASGDEPIPSKSEAPNASGTKVVAAGLSFLVPSDWNVRKPSSRMRLAEVGVPGPGGEALLTVFHFGPGGGGGVVANLDRWEGQIQATSPAKRSWSKTTTGDAHFTMVEGTQSPSRMGQGPSTPVPGQALLGAIIDEPGGPWFFKLLGPAATIKHQASTFSAMLGAATH